MTVRTTAARTRGNALMASALSLVSVLPDTGTVHRGGYYINSRIQEPRF